MNVGLRADLRGRKGPIHVAGAVIAVCLLIAPGAFASELLVCASGSSDDGCVGADSNSGNFHAQLSVKRFCTEDELTVPDGPIGDSMWGACQVLTANAVQVTGQVQFRAGALIRLGSGFSVLSGASFIAEVGPTAVGGNAYVRDESPNGERKYHVRFYLNPDGLTLNTGSDSFDHLVAYDLAANRQLAIGVTSNGVFVAAFDDDGTEHTTRGKCEIILGSGWQHLEASWNASAGSDGDATVSLGTQTISVKSCLGLPGGVANPLGRIDAVEWGAPGEITDGEHGILLLDDFDSRRAGPIGPL